MARVLHLAVGRPTTMYGEQLGDVTGYAFDATRHVRELAHQIAADYVSLWGPEATRDAAVRAIRSARDELRGDAPALFVLSFAGHGGKITDEDGDEEIDHKDEAWALDDAPLIDDEIMALLREFPDNINIVVLSNCCYAGGIDVLETRGSLETWDSPETRGSLETRLETRLEARREGWLKAVALLGQDRLHARLGTTGAPRTRGSSPPGVLSQPRGEPAERPPRKWVLAAVCQLDESFMAPSKSVFSSTILDTVFPAFDGLRRRNPAVTYSAVGQALAAIPGLPMLATPTVSGPEVVLQGRAFVAT